jgi:ABC-type dipeptide/oligopeptide/nickel transport system permease component
MQILKLIAQRLALGVLLLFAVSVLIFAGTEILPGDVAASILKICGVNSGSMSPPSFDTLRGLAGF